MELFKELNDRRVVAKSYAREKVGNTTLKFLVNVGILVAERKNLRLNEDLMSEGIPYRVSQSVRVDSIGNKKLSVRILQIQNYAVKEEKIKEEHPLYYALSMNDNLKLSGNKWSYAGLFLPFAFSLSIRVSLPFIPREVGIFRSEEMVRNAPIRPISLGQPRVYNSKTFYFNLRMARQGAYFIGWVPP